MHTRLAELLDGWGLSTRVQPIVELDPEGAGAPSLHAVESLVRGPAGTAFESARVLFDYVRRKQAEAVMDRECIALALRNLKVVPDPIRVFINVHASTLAKDSGFAGFLGHLAEATSFDLRRATLEILEHGEVGDKRAFLRNLDALQKLGLNFALDDLGLQHCNLGMLLEVAPAYVKLDMEVVHGCHEDPRRRAIIRALAQLSRELDTKIVAEGVERAEETQVLSETGIRYIQGFLYAEPMWPHDFLKSPWCGPARAPGRSPVPSATLPDRPNAPQPA